MPMHDEPRGSSAPAPRSSVAGNGLPSEQRTAKARHDVVSVDDAIRLYEGQWVLMLVSAFDQDQFPVEGRIIAHTGDRDEINEALALEPPRSEAAPRMPYYIFRAFPRICSGPELDEAGENLARQIRAAKEVESGRRRRRNLDPARNRPN